MKKLLLNLLLLIVATLLFYPLTILNAFLVVDRSGKEGKDLIEALSSYFRSTAISIDRYANHEFRTLLNRFLIRKDSKIYYEFGDFEDTISYVLGKNKQIDTLSKAGLLLCSILNFFDKNHVEKTVRLEDLKRLNK